MALYNCSSLDLLDLFPIIRIEPKTSTVDRQLSWFCASSSLTKENSSRFCDRIWNLYPKSIAMTGAHVQHFTLRSPCFKKCIERWTWSCSIISFFFLEDKVELITLEQCVCISFINLSIHDKFQKRYKLSRLLDLYPSFCTEEDVYTSFMLLFYCNPLFLSDRT